MLEGYVLLATGMQKYFEMSLNCVRSIRSLEDHKRPVQLIVDKTDFVSDELKAMVDFIDLMPNDQSLPATLNKLRLGHFARFERNLFVDADCLLLKNGMDTHWDNLRQFDFAIPGRKLTSGVWYRTNIEDLIKSADVPYIVQINSGVIYFSRVTKGLEPFSCAIEMLRAHAGRVKQRHGTGEHGDEPFLGLAMGALNIDPYPLTTENAGSLMISTINSSEFFADLQGHDCHFKKGGVEVSPHFVHFVGLEPKDEYERLCRELASTDF